MESLTCSELIKALQVFEAQGFGDCKTQSEGCDCNGNVRQITLETWPDQTQVIYLNRESAPRT